jgi:hypothetical protein
VKNYARSLYFMKSAGYILVNSLVVSLNGDGKVRTSDMLSNKALGFKHGSFTAIPSRDGSIIAGIAWQADYTTLWRDDQIYGYDTEFRVVFVDANTMTPLREPTSLTARVAIFDYSSYRTRQSAFFFWDEDNALHITDLQQYSIALSSADGTVTNVEVATCIPFPTSSGSVRESDGARLSVDSAGEQVIIVTNTTEDPRFEGYPSPYCSIS